jgi:DUF1009 family protein
MSTALSAHRTAIIAGNGSLPFELAAALEERGEPVVLLGIEGEVEARVANHTHETFAWTQLGRLFKLLKKHKIDRVALAGGVAQRPDITLTDIDLGTVLTLPRMLGAMLAGDDALLTKCIEIIEGKGVTVVGAHQIAPDLLAKSGALGRHALPRGLKEGLSVGRGVLASLGPHDLGQACVVVGKRVVAVEGAEGTAGLLARVGDMRASGRISARYPSLLVKATKALQDLRVDLPSIGPQTVEQAAKAGLSAIAVEADRSLVLERDEALRLADKAQIAVYGFKPDKLR